MKIEILGTRGEIPDSAPRHSKHTGFLVDDKLLIDLGEKRFLKTNPKWILLSHLHPDHAYFMRRGSEEEPPTSVPIYAPEVPVVHENRIRLIQKKFKIGPYEITLIPVLHSKHVKSFAYVIRKGKASFFFTGDLVWINKEYHSQIGTVDLIITEASFIKKGGMIRRDKTSGEVFGHNGVPNLISLLKHFSNTFLFLHFGSWYYENPKEGRKLLTQLGKDQGVEVIVGHDGLIVNIS